jgi:hypothetical protein
MKILTFYLVAAAIAMAAVLGWTRPAKADDGCPPGYTLSVADPLGKQDQNGNGFACFSQAPPNTDQQLGIVGLDDK